MPPALLVLVAVIALIEIVLSLADAGILFDPSLRSRVYIAGRVLGQPAARRHAALRRPAGHHVPQPRLPARLAAAHGDEHDHPAGARPLHRGPLRAAGGAAGVLPRRHRAAGRSTGCSRDGASPMVGASGAVFAFLGLWIAWDWRRHRQAGLSTGAGAAAGAGCWCCSTSSPWSGCRAMLAWEAHLGGFLAGLACGVWIEGRLARNERAARAEARRARARRGRTPERLRRCEVACEIVAVLRAQGCNSRGDMQDGRCPESCPDMPP